MGTMAQYDYDLFVIGAGSGGTRAARMSAAFGARVAIAEDYRIGGTCVIRGCIPKKLLAYASHFSEDFEDARGFGWSVPEAQFSWTELIRNKNAITSSDAFELRELPRRVVIVGGGYIAVEFAGIFHGLGSEVTICYRGEQILRGFDDDIRGHLHDELAKKGIRILLKSDVAS